MDFRLLREVLTLKRYKNIDYKLIERIKKFRNWELCDFVLQYDIKHGDHGKKLLIFKHESKKGEIISIPSTTKKYACFNILFQSYKNPPQWLDYFI